MLITIATENKSSEVDLSPDEGQALARLLRKVQYPNVMNALTGDQFEVQEFEAVLTKLRICLVESGVLPD
jgi:hypothetical protein